MNPFTKAGGTSPPEGRSPRCGLIERLRSDIGTIAEPRARALLGSSADALTRLGDAFDAYRHQCETEWRLRRQPARFRVQAPRA